MESFRMAESAVRWVCLSFTVILVLARLVLDAPISWFMVFAPVLVYVGAWAMMIPVSLLVVIGAIIYNGYVAWRNQPRTHWPRY